MQELDELIAKYHSVPFDAKGEAWGKTTILESLEDHIDEPDVLNFVLSILANPDEYDMSRVELLKMFEGDRAQDFETHRRIGETIAATLRVEKDWLVMCWLSRVADWYSDVPAIVEVSIERLLDREEYSDVRCGCMAALEKLGPTEAVLRVFREIAAEGDDIASYVRHILGVWGKS